MRNEFLTIHEAARELGEYHSTTFRRIERGELKASDRDGRRFVRKSDLVKFMAERAAASMSPVALAASHALAQRVGVSAEALLAGDLDAEQHRRVEKVLGRKFTTKGGFAQRPDTGAPPMAGGFKQPDGAALRKHGKKMRGLVAEMRALGGDHDSGDPHELAARLAAELETLCELIDGKGRGVR